MAAPLSRRKEPWTLQMWNFREKLRQLSIIRATKYACFISVVIVILNVSQNLAPRSHSTENSFLLMTVATKDTIGLRAFRRSASIRRMPLKILGFNQSWTGFGLKVWYLKQELEKYKTNSEKIILFSDANDALINGDVQDIVRKFKRTNFRILFSAEHKCYPNPLLCPKYPAVKMGKKYLNSGGFIGYASELYELVKSVTPSVENDQEYFTEAYLSEETRRRLRMGLDHRCEIFQTFESQQNIVHLVYNGSEVLIHNRDYDTYPLIVHAAGSCKPIVYTLRNFLPRIWTPHEGCIFCLENSKSLTKVNRYPVVVVVVFVESFERLGEFYQKLTRLTYPKEKMHLFIYDATHQKNETISFLIKHGKEYNSTMLINEEIDASLTSNEQKLMAADLSGEYCEKKECEFYFMLESIVHLENRDSLKLLIEENRSVVAPLLLGPNRKTTNFSPHIELYHFVKYNSSSDGNGNRDKRRGLWSVSVVSSCYLIRADVIQYNRYNTRPRFGDQEYQDADIALSFILIANEVELFVTNRVDFGHLTSRGKLTCDIFCQMLDST